MLLKPLAFALILTMTTAHAETRGEVHYRIRPHYGELESFGHGCSPHASFCVDPQRRPGECDDAGKWKLWQAVFLSPVFTVDLRTHELRVNFFYDDSAAKHTDTAAKQQVSSQTTDRIVGSWTSSNPAITFGGSIEERRGKVPFARFWINIETKNADGTKSTCTETWSGMGEKF